MSRLRHRSRRKNKQRKIIIISICSILLFMSAGYAAMSTHLEIDAKGNIKEKSRVIQAWSATDQTDFHSDYYRENIVSATFLDNNNIPSNATESWDVSEDKKGGVMAWVIPNNEDNTKYGLYIGANGGVIANEYSSYLFYNFINLKNIDFKTNFDTSNAITMYCMFANCRELLTLDLTTFDTRKVTSMANMFVSSEEVKPMKIQIIELGENFVTSNVTNMHSMFGNCNYLTTLDVSNFDTSNVLYMNDMFSSCYSLTNIDVSNWDTSKVTNMHGMFFSCRNVTKLNLCSFDTSNVKDMSVMFAYNYTLKNVYVGPNWTTANANTANMFNGSSVSSVTTGQC